MNRSLRKARKTYLRMVQNVQLIGCLPKLSQMDDPVISFTEEDARRIHHPYDEGKNEEGICLNLDLLEEVRVAAEQRMTRY